MDDAHPDVTPPRTESRPSRRAVLRGAAGVGALGVAAPILAACGSDANTATPDVEPPTSSAGGGGDSPSGGGSSPNGGGSPSGGSAGLVTTGDVPVGGGVIDTKLKIVVTQPTKGDFKAFSAVCTHQGCTVGTVESGTINCPCHGSTFSVDDGSVVSGPATAPLPAKKIAVDGDQISLA